MIPEPLNGTKDARPAARSIEWRTIEHAPIYEVSNEGTVRLRVDHGNRRAGLVMKGSVIRGYRWHVLKHRDGAKYMNSAHSLVLTAFVGPRPTRLHHAAHGDSDRSNNRLENLRWATPEENRADGVAHGSWKGERHYKAKLTDEDVIAARVAYAFGARQCDLARHYGVHRGTMRALLIHRSWSHVL